MYRNSTSFKRNLQKLIERIGTAKHSEILTGKRSREHSVSHFLQAAWGVPSQIPKPLSVKPFYQIEGFSSQACLPFPSTCQLRHADRNPRLPGLRVFHYLRVCSPRIRERYPAFASGFSSNRSPTKWSRCSLLGQASCFLKNG